MKRALVLAAERALGLDPPRAVAHLDRALELVSDEPERLELVVRRADAAIQAGRVQEAVAALDEVLPALRAGSDAVLTARALTLRSLVSRYIGEDELLVPLGGRGGRAARAVRLHLAPLLDALTELAGVLTVSERNDDAMVVASRAFALADELGVERPARLLGFRGVQRFFLGDRGGLDDMDEAYERLVASGASRFATVVRFNRVRALVAPRGAEDARRVRGRARLRPEQRPGAVPRGSRSERSRSASWIRGDMPRSSSSSSDHLPEIEAAGDLFIAESLRSWLAAAYAAQGDLEAAELELLAVLETAIGRAAGARAGVRIATSRACAGSRLARPSFSSSTSTHAT